MSLNKAFIFSGSLSAPIDVENKKGESKCILVGHLISPRSVLFRPRDIAVIDEFRLISFFEISLEYFLFCLDGEILMEATPVVEIIVAESKLLSQETRQHETIIILIKIH